MTTAVFSVLRGVLLRPLPHRDGEKLDRMAAEPDVMLWLGDNSYLRENEWLMSIKQRTGIPGGVCEFDLPSYHFWLQQGAEQRRHDIQQWLAPFLPTRDAINIVLRLLRESGKTTAQTARQGVYQQMMAGRMAQMLRIRLSREYTCLPEISANKYALNIRFTTQEGMQRPKAADTDVEFELTFCNL